MPHSTQTHFALYGALRSGTTLLRLMLHQNTRIASPGETDFLFDHQIGQTPDGPRLDFFHLNRDRMFTSVIPDHQNIPQDGAAMGAILDALTNRPGKVDPKLLLIHHRNLQQLLAQFPDIKIIHLIRDPRDVARSSIGMGWASTTYVGVEHWLKTEKQWAELGKSLPPDRVLTVRYEDLIGDAENWLKRMCDFIGVPYQPQMLDYDQISTYSKPDPALVYQWKTKQSAKEIGWVEARVGPLLGDLGYEPSGHPPVYVGPLGRAQFRLRNKVYDWRIRFLKYGYIDPIIAAVARKLKWYALSRNAEARIEAKTRKWVK